MQVKIKHEQIGQAIDLLFHLSLKGKQSRHRTTFIKKLTERLHEVEGQRNDLAKEHSFLDEEGNPKMLDNGKRYDIKDMEAFQKDVQELYEEELVLEGGDNQRMLTTVKEVLLNSDESYSGKKALTYDYLCEQFEEADLS
ncbi:Protein of unknown function [Thalassobacillus cyri]|uniref:DUF1617 family protein n=1 Tax=Thalassobacillus cyri TaxID=571932 RepID=A0A1H4C1E8_9BACI|nr:DUF1617 family protein [Thalassobacillus cyri]SEA54143.1 Protein of unknown function [Thalassobacillus cyri]